MAISLNSNLNECTLNTEYIELYSTDTSTNLLSPSDISSPRALSLSLDQTIDTEIIDGRRSFLDSSTSSANSLNTGQALEICNRTIITPYLIFLKLIGWRKFSVEMELHESKIKKFFNFMFPLIVFLLLLLTLVTRALLCFDRTEATVDRVNGSFTYMKCNNSGKFFLFSIIALLSYLFGLYLFRFTYPEYLVTLIEKVFLDFADRHGTFSQKRLLFEMRILFFCGLTWMIFSVIVNALRIASQRLLEKDTYFERLTSYNISYLSEQYSTGENPSPEHYELHVVLVLITIIGFTIIDFLYVALVVNYALQCQVIYFAIRATTSNFRTTHYQVDAAIKKIRLLQDYLKVLNGKLSSLMSLQLFAFVGGAIQTFVNIKELERHQTLGIVTGVCEFLEWFSLIFFVTMQAVRVTVACSYIKTSGLELRTRPFAHAETQQLELDSFLLYTSSITVDVRLVHIPMKPLLVAPVLFSVAVIWRSFFRESFTWT
ncbi:uncharacterized protein [Dysidea avara]|uniref:uncharacterized protein n=1 Tax=Dysidea avara TaxID=196820 RepID=UPI003324C504